MAQYRSTEWCYTINAPKNSDEETAIEFLEPLYDLAMGLDAVYHVCKGEVGESGNYHLQGFIMFDRIYNRSEVKEMFDFKVSKIHVEKRADKSSCWKAADYCKKPETAWDAFPLFELGELPVKPCATKDEAIARGAQRIADIYEQHDSHDDPTEHEECPYCDLVLNPV